MKNYEKIQGMIDRLKVLERKMEYIKEGVVFIGQPGKGNYLGIVRDIGLDSLSGVVKNSALDVFNKEAVSLKKKIDLMCDAAGIDRG